MSWKCHNDVIEVSASIPKTSSVEKWSPTLHTLKWSVHIFFTLVVFGAKTERSWRSFCQTLHTPHTPQPQNPTHRCTHADQETGFYVQNQWSPPLMCTMQWNQTWVICRWSRPDHHKHFRNDSQAASQWLRDTDTLNVCRYRGIKAHCSCSYQLLSFLLPIVIHSFDIQGQLIPQHKSNSKAKNNGKRCVITHVL